MKTRSSAIGSERRATGRFTSTPRCSIGAVTMKMTSSTSITSTSGTTLISEIDAVTRRTRPVRPVVTSSVGLTFGIGRASSARVYVKLRSAMFRNSSAKSSMEAVRSFTTATKWL